jgi:multidrug transporter EmrE-like cation transporter
MSVVQGATLTLVEAVGDFAFKSEAVGGNPRWALVGFAGYMALAATLRTMLLGGAKLSVLNGMWDATSNVVTHAMGWLWFGETLTASQHLGFGLTLVGMFLLKNGHEQ